MTEDKKRKHGLPRLLLILALSGLAIFAACGALAVFTEWPAYVPVVAGAVLYLAAGAVILLLSLREGGGEDDETENDIQRSIADVLKRIGMPVVITTPDGKLVWINLEFKRLFGSDASPVGKNIEELTGCGMEVISTADPFTGTPVTLAGAPYRAVCCIMPTGEKDFWMTVFVDTSDLEKAMRELDAETAVIVYAAVDNLDSLSSLVKISYREAVLRVDATLREWAAEHGGFLREYEGDKFLIAFPRNRLAECIAGGFDILERVRKIGLGDSGLSVTVSMGVSTCGKTLGDRERDAAAALETALQRGGDQVVLRSEDGSAAYFGGLTKTDFTRTLIASRTVCARLIQLINGAGNVLIMGHKAPDFDAIGGCVGLCCIARAFSGSVYIVSDRDNVNFRTAVPRLLSECPEYENIFISGDEALDMIRSDTLLILADVNNMKIVECPDVAANVATQVIIDHHRKTAEFAIEPQITFIEPGTSSCCELVTEMIESLSEGASSSDILNLRPAEADMLLAGIMLDTKNFTRTTGEETFAAAVFLKSRGASSEKVTSFFFKDIEAFRKESELYRNMFFYHGGTVITGYRIEGEDPVITQDDRITVSRMAETMLTVHGLEAAFAIVYNDDEVLVSARSKGSINVQLILEALGGGGRFDAAGAQVTGMSFEEVGNVIKEKIDSVLDEIEG